MSEHGGDRTARTQHSPRTSRLPGDERESALVVGFAVTGQAVARAYRAEGRRVVAVDDGERKADAEKLAASLGVDLVWGPSRARLGELAARAGTVVLSPGVPPTHSVFSVADPSKIVPEIEVAASMADVPVLAVTGTNGKTTVTSLVTAMLQAAGTKAEAVGNIGRPFIEAVGAHEAELFVVEVSSFQLSWTKSFHPFVAAWLNLAEDHLDWHGDLEQYAAAKARIWANETPGDVAVANAADPVVMAHAASVRGRLVTFGRGGDVHERKGTIVAPEGEICRVEELPRGLQHDVENACAAAAMALAAGADTDSCAAALRAGIPMPHRIELVAESGGVRYYDDSKATTPAAVLAALKGFDSAILIAGGRNKGLDLSVMASGLEEEARHGEGPGPRRLGGVVAIGESASEVVSAFGRLEGVPVIRATSMTEAVTEAARLAKPGDAVLLSPGCASFDWYRSYGERGDDFARIARALGSSGPESWNDGGEAPLEIQRKGAT